MLFEYMSAHSPHSHIVNYHQFLKRFLVLWPKKEIFRSNETKDEMEWRLTNERKVRKGELRMFIFEFMRMQGDKTISILDLIQLCAHFPIKTTIGGEERKYEFGEEVHHMLNRYIHLNIKPAYVPIKMEYSFSNFIKYLPYPCLIKELEHAFVKQIEEYKEKQDSYSDDGKTVVKFPISAYKMTSI